jgi:hypothetical protein
VRHYFNLQISPLLGNANSEIIQWLYEIIERKKNQLPCLGYLVLWCCMARFAKRMLNPAASRIIITSEDDPDSAKHVATWIECFGFPTAFQRAVVHFTWSTDLESLLFNVM